MSEALFSALVRLVPDVLDGRVQLAKPKRYVELLGVLSDVLKDGEATCADSRPSTDVPIFQT